MVGPPALDAARAAIPLAARARTPVAAVVLLKKRRRVKPFFLFVFNVLFAAFTAAPVEMKVFSGTTIGLGTEASVGNSGVIDVLDTSDRASGISDVRVASPAVDISASSRLPDVSGAPAGISLPADSFRD